MPRVPGRPIGGLPFLLLVAAVTGARRAGAQAVDSTTLRPTKVEVRIKNDRENDGTYRAQGISRICGKLDMMMPHRANSFAVEFPDDETNLDVTSVSFDADTLPPKSNTKSFYLAVGIRTADGGRPPLYVVRAKEPQYGEPGTATRTKRASIDTLTLDGVATKGTKVGVTMTVVCGPKP